MLEALVLLLLVGGIVVLARRWPDVERRIFPGHSDHDHTKPEPTPEPDPVDEDAPSATGVLHTRPVRSEPDVDPSAVTHSEPKQSEPEPVSEPVSTIEPEPVSEPDPEPAAPAEPTPPTPPVSDEPKPGGLVSGAPARPSQPAYLDATGGEETSQSAEELSEEVDRAYRDRDYDTAEAACLKLLAEDPKNHKYMTRLGQVYQEMGQLEDAKEAFEEAKKIDPKNFFVLNRLTEVERLLSDKGGRTKK